MVPRPSSPPRPFELLAADAVPAASAEPPTSCPVTNRVLAIRDATFNRLDTPPASAADQERGLNTWEGVAPRMQMSTCLSVGPWPLVVDGPAVRATFPNGNVFALCEWDGYAAFFFKYVVKIEHCRVSDPSAADDPTRWLYSPNLQVTPDGLCVPKPPRGT